MEAPIPEGAAFGDDEVRRGRAYFARLLAEGSHDLEAQPPGLLATVVSAGTPHATDVLTRTAFTLAAARTAATPDSVATFHRKLGELLRARDERELSEALLEFEVAALLIRLVSPIAFEPLVSPEQAASAERPTSPDLAVHLPDGDVMIEVASIPVEALERWKRTVARARSTLAARLTGVGIAREVVVVAPQQLDESKVGALATPQVVDAIRREERGELRVRVGRGSARVQWQPLPSAPGGTGASDAPLQQAFATMFEPDADLQAALDDAIWRALVDTLQQRRARARRGVQHLVVARYGHDDPDTDPFSHLVQTRIWPDPRYAWLTGFGMYMPRVGDGPAGRDARLYLDLNPNGLPPPSPALRALAERGEPFHFRPNRRMGIPGEWS